MNRQLAGFIVIDKPEGITSHEVVRVVRSHLPVKKVGHLGTLDPMATGVLPLALGGATRLVQFLMKGRKIYQGTIQLGFSTDTYDRLGQPTSEFQRPRFSQCQLEAVTERMRGEQLQTPPAFSAKKLDGRRAYHLARRGLKVKIPPQRINIEEFRVWGAGSNSLEFEVHCSPGTYVRSLAHDLGRKLACGAHLSRLRRLASGKFTLKMSLNLDRFLIKEDWLSSLLSTNSMLDDIPSICVSQKAQEHFVHGRPFKILGLTRPSIPWPYIRILSRSGQLLGLAEGKLQMDSVEDKSRIVTLLSPRVVL